ncbi:MAG TPA: GNAT family N-acetyltransferase [Kofleriaceae bacterium]|nr:GNAT family N-acetyltransferase [Kofleriaceae bacterium]
MALTYRPARSTDLAAMSRVALAAKRTWGYPEGWIELWRDELEYSAETLDRHEIYCAEWVGAIIGVVSISIDGEVGEVEGLWVLPEHGGRGVGRALMALAIQRAAARGASVLRIASDPHAEGFYRRLGARLVGYVESLPAGRRLPRLELELPLVGA